MPEGKISADTVSKNVLVIAVMLAVVLTAVIVGSIVFAWQNSASTEDDIFRQELLETEGSSLENQRKLLAPEEQN